MTGMNRRLSGPGELVAAGVAVAYRAGLSGVTLRSVARQLGVPIRTARRVQRDEQQLVADTFDSIAQSELTETKRKVLEHPSPTRQLQALVETISASSGVELDIIWAQSWSLGQSNPALAELVRSQEAAWHSFVASIVRRGVRFDAFPAVDEDEFSAQILALCAGVNAYSLVGYRSEIDRTRLMTALVEAELGVRIDRTDATTVHRR